MCLISWTLRSGSEQFIYNWKLEKEPGSGSSGSEQLQVLKLKISTIAGHCYLNIQRCYRLTACSFTGFNAVKSYGCTFSDINVSGNVNIFSCYLLKIYTVLKRAVS